VGVDAGELADVSGEAELFTTHEESDARCVGAIAGRGSTRSSLSGDGRAVEHTAPTPHRGRTKWRALDCVRCQGLGRA